MIRYLKVEKHHFLLINQGHVFIKFLLNYLQYLTKLQILHFVTDHNFDYIIAKDNFIYRRTIWYC